MELPIIITTYDRGGGERTMTALETIKALKANLLNVTPEFIICDDSSPNPGHIPALQEALKDDNTVFLDSKKRGVGVSKNLGLDHAFNNFNYTVLLLEDDWILKEPLNIQAYMDVLEQNDELGMIRLGYLGGLDLRAKFAAYLGHTFWDVYDGSYAYSGQVSLRHKRWYDIVGYHTPDLTPGDEELDVCYRYAKLDQDKKLKILFPADYGVTFQHGPFMTIGDFSVNSGR